jgi:hypothetical protein
MVTYDFFLVLVLVVFCVLVDDTLKAIEKRIYFYKDKASQSLTYTIGLLIYDYQCGSFLIAIPYFDPVSATTWNDLLYHDALSYF